MVLQSAWRFASKGAGALAAGALLVSFASCGPVESTPTSESTDNQFLVYGKVTSRGQGLGAVTVSAGEATATTEATGSYRIFLPAGEQSLEFKKEGLVDVQKSVTGAAKATVKLDVEMAAGKPSEEYVYRAGHRVERPVSPAGGWIEFDAWVPESGRATQWNKSPLCALYEGEYHGGTLGLVDLMPYKMKWCYAQECREPRISVPWGKWNHVKLEWSSTEVWATIAGAKFGGELVKPFGAGAKLFYGAAPGGERPPLSGAKIKNIVWSR